jgi:hypothetical protein
MTLARLTLAMLRERWFANILPVLMLAIGVAAAADRVWTHPDL